MGTFPQPDLSGIRRHDVTANGIRIHVAEQGDGPMVLLVHGFPESWYSWRHQLPALAAAGYRAVAVDVRGYGRSSKPGAIDAYRMTQHVADNLGVVRALGAEQAVVVGHDWGAPIAGYSALLRPDVFRALATLSIPWAPRGDTRPTELFRAIAGDDEFYIEYFQQPGRAERELEADARGWLRGFYASAGAGAPADATGLAIIPRGARMRDKFWEPEVLPDWLGEADVDVYAGEFERTGFTGGLNRYRNVDRDWEDMAVVAGLPLAVPYLFIGGADDGGTTMGRAAIERFPETAPHTAGVHVLDHCGHWTQQEQPAEVNRLLVDYVHGLR